MEYMSEGGGERVLRPRRTATGGGSENPTTAIASRVATAAECREQSLANPRALASPLPPQCEALRAALRRVSESGQVFGGRWLNEAPGSAIRESRLAAIRVGEGVDIESIVGQQGGAPGTATTGTEANIC